VIVPGDFVVVGGGVVGTDASTGAFVTKLASGLDAQWRDWQAETRDAAATLAHDNETYAIGMKIRGLARSELHAHLSWTTGAGSTTNARRPFLSP
jgi:hypothetical protein